MTDLTEQWKKGELPNGWYYVKLIPDFEYPDDIAFYGENFELYSDEDIEQVLAPLPDYIEWKAKLEENTKLKELLKECIIYVDRYVAFSVVQGNEEREVESKKLLTKINQALGEK